MKVWKKEILKILIIYIYCFVFFLLQYKKLKYTLIYENCENLNLCFYFYFELNDEYISLSRLVWKMSPIYLHIYLFGTYIYDKVNMDNFYVIYRQKSRKVFYFSETINFQILSLFTAFLFCLCLGIPYIEHFHLVKSDFIFIVSIIFFIFLIIFFLSFFFSIVSIYLGSKFGFFFITLVIPLYSKISLYLLDSGESWQIWKFFNPVFNFIIQIYNENLSLSSIVAGIIQYLVILFLGFLLVKKMDIGLQNWELE